MDFYQTQQTIPAAWSAVIVTQRLTDGKPHVFWVFDAVAKANFFAFARCQFDAPIKYAKVFVDVGIAVLLQFHRNVFVVAKRILVFQQ
jgi:hypothetical protein